MKKKPKSDVIIRDKVKSKSLNPMAEIIPQYYSVFGVQQYHTTQNYGAGTSIYIIDSGFNEPGNQDLKNVIVEHFGAQGSPSEHGALTAALIAAPINGFGVVGIAPEATVYLGDVDNSNGDIFTSLIVSALESAMSKNVDIINISLGGRDPDPQVSNAILRAFNQGILIFVAAGNSGSSFCEYPACDVGAIGVGSCNIDHIVSDFSNVNPQVVLYAPGEDYPLPDPNGGGITYVSGTSFSSPFAAGLAALVLSARRSGTGNFNAKISREEMISILRNPQHLNAAALTFPPRPSLAAFWWIILVVIVVIIVIAIIVSLVIAANRNRSPTPTPPPPRVIVGQNLPTQYTSL